MPKDHGVYLTRRTKDITADGTVTIYTDKLHPNFYVKVSSMSVCGHKGETNELVRFGVEYYKNKHYVKSGTPGATDVILQSLARIYAGPRMRFFVEVEAANDGEQICLSVNGIWRMGRPPI